MGSESFTAASIGFPSYWQLCLFYFQKGIVDSVPKYVGGGAGFG